MSGVEHFDGWPSVHCAFSFHTGRSVLTRTLLPWPAIHEMRDMEMIITSMVSVCKKDNPRNQSPGEFREQKWVHRTKNVTILEVEQRTSSTFFLMKACQGPKSSRVSDNIMERVNSLEDKCILNP
jgi:hypothetical protein